MFKLLMLGYCGMQQRHLKINGAIMDPKYLGGKKRNGGYFGYITVGVFRVGSNHVPMTKLERDRFFKSNYLQYGRLLK